MVKPTTASAAKAAADGAFCQVVQRRVSGLASPWAARHLSPNGVTTVGLCVGSMASLAALLGLYAPAAALVQVFGVVSCMDGEVARIRRQVTATGDIFDTVVDRIVEVLVVTALAVNAYRQGQRTAFAAGMALLAAVLLLVVSAEKYRSSLGATYPKRLWEPAFSWISAGSDARLLVISCALLVAVFVAPGRTLVLAMWMLTGMCVLNLCWRTLVLIRRLPAGAPASLEEADESVAG